MLLMYCARCLRCRWEAADVVVVLQLAWLYLGDNMLTGTLPRSWSSLKPVSMQCCHIVCVHTTTTVHDLAMVLVRLLVHVLSYNTRALLRQIPCFCLCFAAEHFSANFITARCRLYPRAYHTQSPLDMHVLCCMSITRN